MFILWSKTGHRNANDLLVMLRMIGDKELSNYALLFRDIVNAASYVVFPEFDGTMGKLEELGTAPISMLESKATGKLIPVGSMEPMGCTIVKAQWLRLEADGTMMLEETLAIPGFSTEVKYEVTIIPAGAQM